MSFLPISSERFQEAWFPFKGLGGVTQATPEGSLEVLRREGRVIMAFCPTASFADTVTVMRGGRTVFGRAVTLGVLDTFRDSVAVGEEEFEIRIGKGMRYRSVEEPLRATERPLVAPETMGWDSDFGRAVEGRERARQRDYRGALAAYRASLIREPTYLPSLAGAAELFFRRMEDDSAAMYAGRALAVDTYDPEANFVFGLTQRRRGRMFDAEEAFGIAARSRAYRPAANVQLAEIALADNRRADAMVHAARAVRDDHDNISARHLLAILYRLAGDSARAAQTCEELLTLDPLCHAARSERFLLIPSSSTRDNLAHHVRNELPHETYLELASTYVRLGLMGDAATVLALAPRHPMVELWLAWLADRSGRADEGQVMLTQALARAPLQVFPFRPEDMAVLRWADERRPSWKTKYFLALLLWSLGRDNDAGIMFDHCGNGADFAPLYLARSVFRRNDPRRALDDLRRALEVGPGEWRTSEALATFLNEQGRHAEALTVVRDAVQRFPRNYMLRFLLARTLLFTGEVAASLGILDTLHILPFEGARYGREAYRHASILAALQENARRRHDEALRLIARARFWPERLGAGRPYDVDERVEDFLEASVRRSVGDVEASMTLLDRVAVSTTSPHRPGSVYSLFGALAIRSLGDAARGRQLLEDWQNHEPGNPAARWAILMYDGRREEALKLERELRASVLNRAAGDQEFVLVCDVANLLPL